jgi:hypothetical protein
LFDELEEQQMQHQGNDGTLYWENMEVSGLRSVDAREN